MIILIDGLTLVVDYVESVPHKDMFLYKVLRKYECL